MDNFDNSSDLKAPVFEVFFFVGVFFFIYTAMMLRIFLPQKVLNTSVAFYFEPSTQYVQTESDREQFLVTSSGGGQAAGATTVAKESKIQGFLDLIFNIPQRFIENLLSSLSF